MEFLLPGPKLFESQDPHLDPQEGIDSQVTMQLVGQHGCSPLAHSIAENHLPDKGAHIGEIEALGQGKAIEEYISFFCCYNHNKEIFRPLTEQQGCHRV